MAGYIPVEFSRSKDGGKMNDNVQIDLNMATPSFQTMYQNFDRYYSVYPDKELVDLKHYIFMVRPELNILSETNPRQISETCAKDSWMQYMVRDHNVMTQHLSTSLDAEHDFMPFLVGRSESLQIPDYSLRNYTISQPYTNYLMPYATNAIESKTGGSFDITFREDNMLRIHKTFYTWLYYIDGVSRNVFTPKKKYILYNKFDYVTSVYHIVTAPDARTILWWDKYTGCIPINVPNSDMSFNLRGGTENKISISFAYFIHEALTPDIFVDFNKNSRAAMNMHVPVYNEVIHGTGNAFVGAPFIQRQGSAYYLRWRAPKKV